MSPLIVSIVVSLKDHFIVNVRKESCNIKEISKLGGQFEHFPCAFYATDVKFHQANRQQGNQIESKLYYSGKHHYVGIKLRFRFLQ